MPRATHSPDLPSKYRCALKQIKDGLHIECNKWLQISARDNTKELTAEQSLKKVFKVYKYNDIPLRLFRLCIFLRHSRFVILFRTWQLCLF